MRNDDQPEPDIVFLPSGEGTSQADEKVVPATRFLISGGCMVYPHVGDDEDEEIYADCRYCGRIGTPGTTCAGCGAPLGRGTRR